MNYRNLFQLTLLLLGFLFSTIVVFNFNLSDRFDFQGIAIKSPIQFFDLAMISSSEVSLNSQLTGYLFYLFFAITCIKKLDLSNKGSFISLVVFFSLIGSVFISDFYSYYQDINHQFTGRHYRIGLLVFLLGLSIYYRLQGDKQTEVKSPFN